MKKCLFVLMTAVMLGFSATPAFLQETGRPAAQHEHGTTGGDTTQQGGTSCPMMGMGGMGMMANMMSGMGSDPKMMGKMMQMRGEMMMKMGEVMMKHGRMMQQDPEK